jgi:hypothetical protein
MYGAGAIISRRAAQPGGQCRVNMGQAQGEMVVPQSFEDVLIRSRDIKARAVTARLEAQELRARSIALRDHIARNEILADLANLPAALDGGA